MSSDRTALNTVLERALSGRGAHVELEGVFSGVEWKTAGLRPKGASHSLFQLLNHMIYWQHWVVKWLDGKNPAAARHASDSWPGGPGPANAREWHRTVRDFRWGLDRLHRRSRAPDPFAKIGAKSRLEMLHTIASHNSYHIGQAVLLRQLLGKWPPPSGGLTW